MISCAFLLLMLLVHSWFIWIPILSFAPPSQSRQLPSFHSSAQKRPFASLSRQSSLKQQQQDDDGSTETVDNSNEITSSSSTISKEDDNNNNLSLQDVIVVICPGFGNDAVDYVDPLGGGLELGMQRALQRRNVKEIKIVPIKRLDWLRVAAGLLDPSFWTSNQLPTGMAYGWYIKRVRDTVLEAVVGDESLSNEKSTKRRNIVLVGHSAGGWLARAAVGDCQSRCNNDSIENDDKVEDNQDWTQYIGALVTLGTPQIPPPNGVNCATRGALANTNQLYPGAYCSKDFPYITVVGDAISIGDDMNESLLVPQGRPEVDDIYEIRGEGSAQRVAEINYQAILGPIVANVDNNDVIVSGDGVIPIDAAHLDGAAKQITLEGIIHSINEAGTTRPATRWYGNDNVVDKWLIPTMEEINNHDYSQTKNKKINE